MNFKTELELWKPDVSGESLRIYKIGVRKFLDFLEFTSGQDGYNVPTERDLIDFRDYLLKERGLKPTTVNLWITGTTQFFKHLSMKSNIPQLDIGYHIKRLKVGELYQNPPPFTDAERKMFFASFNHEFIQEKREYAVDMMATYLGLEASEIIELRIGDITKERDRTVVMVSWRRNLGKKHMMILRGEPRGAVMEYLKERFGGETPDPNEYLFVSHSKNNNKGKLSTCMLRLEFRKRLKIAGIKRKGLAFSSMRKYILFHLVEQKCDLARLHVFSRNKGLSITIGYFVSYVDRFDHPPEDWINLSK